MLVALNPKGSKDKKLPHFDIAIWKQMQEVKAPTPPSVQPPEAAGEDPKLVTAKDVAEIAPENEVTPPPASRKPSMQVIPPSFTPNELETLVLRSHRLEAVPQVENVSLMGQV